MTNEDVAKNSIYPNLIHALQDLTDRNNFVPKYCQRLTTTEKIFKRNVHQYKCKPSNDVHILCADTS